MHTGQETVLAPSCLLLQGNIGVVTKTMLRSFDGPNVQCSVPAYMPQRGYVAKVGSSQEAPYLAWRRRTGWSSRRVVTTWRHGNTATREVCMGIRARK